MNKPIHKSGNCECAFIYQKDILGEHPETNEKIHIDDLTLFVPLDKLPKFKRITLNFFDGKNECRLSFCGWLIELKTKRILTRASKEITRNT